MSPIIWPLSLTKDINLKIKCFFLYRKRDYSVNIVTSKQNIKVFIYVVQMPKSMMTRLYDGYIFSFIKGF